MPSIQTLAPLLFRSPLAALAILGASAFARPQEAAPPAHIGFYARELDELAEPVAAAIATDGTLCVAEAARGALALFRADGALAKRISLRGASPLVEPAGVAFGTKGRIYWTDAATARVHVCDREGVELEAFGMRGLAPGELWRPLGLDVSAERVAVADAGNHRVELFDLDGRHLMSLGGHGREEGRMIRPADVAFAPDGSLFVADEGNCRIQRFDAQGRFVRAWGDFGPFPGLFVGPTAIEVRAGAVFVCDRGNHRVQVFDLDGKHLYEWGEHAVLPFQGRGRMQYPSGLAVSADGSLALVTECVDDRAQLFANDEEHSQGERLVPRPPGNAVSSHYGECAAADGDWIAITAPEDHALLVFEASEPEPRLVAHAGEYGDGFGLFLRPEGACLDGASGTLAVTDLDRRRLSIFHLEGFGERAVGYDPFLYRFVKALDFERLFEALPAGTLAAVPDPGALARGTDGRYYVCDRRNACVLELDRELGFARALARGELRSPSAVAFDAARRRLYVVDEGAARVQAIDLGTGRCVRGDEGAGWPARALLAQAADARAPRWFGVALAGETLVVSDAWRDELVALDLDGHVRARFGKSGLGRVEFREPRGMAFDGKGRVLVVESSNHRAQLLTPEGQYLGVFGSRPFLEPALVPGRPARGAKSEDER